ncbi:MAG: proteasome lid subunit RPN8/RPN11 [Saprospiraceae bacterium]|jgi:proteasome lid subunit RPN8/RPN11
MSSIININQTVFEAISSHGEATFPNECCGFLYGDDSDGRQITSSMPIHNSKEGDQRRRFEISPLDYMKAERYALENDTQLLGIYHSHPNHPAIASVHDLAKAMPFFSYVIVSILEGKYADIKSWKLYDEKREFNEEKVRIWNEELEIRTK